MTRILRISYTNPSTHHSLPLRATYLMRRLEVTLPQTIQLRIETTPKPISPEFLLFKTPTYYGRFSGKAYSFPREQANCTPRSRHRRSSGSRYSRGKVWPSLMSGALSTRMMYRYQVPTRDEPDVDLKGEE